MKSLQEYMISQKLEQYLLEDAVLAAQCLFNVEFVWDINYDIPKVFESLGRFNNCGQVLHKISSYISNNITEDTLDEYDGKTETFDVSDCDAYCKTVQITFKKLMSEKSEGAFESIDKQGNVKIVLKYSIGLDMHDIEGAILHELLHGYEEWNRLNKGRKSIFAEFGQEYENSKKNLARDTEIEKPLAVLKYFYNPKERNAFFGMLEHDVEKIVKNLKPTRSNLKYSEAIEQIKKVNHWKEFFRLVEFACQMDSYSDRQIERAYYNVVKSSKDISKELRDHIDKIKQGNPDNDYFVIKSAKDIKKEINRKIYKFQNKFNTLFSKVYCNCVTSTVQEAMEHPSIIYEEDPYKFL